MYDSTAKTWTVKYEGHPLGEDLEDIDIDELAAGLAKANAMGCGGPAPFFNSHLGRNESRGGDDDDGVDGLESPSSGSELAISGEDDDDDVGSGSDDTDASKKQPAKPVPKAPKGKGKAAAAKPATKAKAKAIQAKTVKAKVKPAAPKANAVTAIRVGSGGAASGLSRPVRAPKSKQGEEHKCAYASYGGGCIFASSGGDGPSMIKCADCPRVLHHACQGKYEHDLYGIDGLSDPASQKVKMDVGAVVFGEGKLCALCHKKRQTKFHTDILKRNKQAKERGIA